MTLDPAPACAVCGENPFIAATEAGCGLPIKTCAEVYRCTDCDVPFHKECAKKHFAEQPAKGLE